VKIGSQDGGLWGINIDREGDDIICSSAGWERFAEEYKISDGDVLLNIITNEKWEVNVFGCRGREKVRWAFFSM
jgi:hypothetical protein